jgi:NAD(P)-dependent dehydrogenase (short-subunit alcohol dehydrogenase family)
MAPAGLAILLGAGPTTGAGIARILSDPSHGNLAVALLSRSGDDNNLASTIAASIDSSAQQQQQQQPQLKAFKTDTTRSSLETAFASIKEWASSLSSSSSSSEEGTLKLKLAIFNIKHSHRTPFLNENPTQFSSSLETYVTGAMNFAQLSLAWMMEQYPPPNSENEELPLQKRGTLIFTGTLGALRTNPGYAAYGAGRAGVRMLAQSLAREFSAQGVHVVHAIANGAITDRYHDWHGGQAGKGKGEDAEKVLKGQKIRAESVGKLYLSLMEAECDLWVHELDMRPAAEKF